MQLVKNYCVLLISCLCLIPAMGQQKQLNNLYFQHITQNDGLAFNGAETFLQDRNGFWWIGGRALERYDGYRFKLYFTGNENLTVAALAEDDNGVIWAGTDRGLFRLDTTTDQFERIAENFLVANEVQPLRVANMLFDDLGDLWIATGNFYARLKKDSSRVENVSSLLKWENGSDATYLTLDARGWLWIQCNKEFGISCYDTRKKIVYNHDHHPVTEQVFDLRLSNMYVLYDNNGKYWMHDGFNSLKLYLYDAETQRLNSFGLNHSRGTTKTGNAVPGKMLIDDNGFFWIQIQERVGLARYNNANGEMEYLFASGDKKNALSDDYYPSNPSRAFYQDHQGNFWYGGKGISIFSPYKQIFYHSTESNGKLTDSDNKDHSRFSTNGVVWMNDSCYYMTRYGGGLTRLTAQLEIVETIKTPTEAGKLFWSVYSVDGETLFFNDQSGKMYSMNIRTRKFRPYSSDSFGTMLMSSYLIESPNKVWVGHWGRGLSLFDPSNDSITHYPLRIHSNSIRPVQILSILPQGDDFLWLVANQIGLHLFNKKEGRIVYSWYYNNDSNRNSKASVFYDAKWIDQETILIASWQGLIFFNTRTKTGERLTMEDNLPDNACLGILLEQNKEYAWVNTHKRGVFRINLKTRSVSTYSGWEGNGSNEGEVFCTKLQNGMFLFASITGYFYFDPLRIHHDVGNRALQITGFFVNGLPRMLNPGFSVDQPIQLRYQENNILISLSTLDFWNAPGIRFYFRKRHDSAWQPVLNKSQVEFLSLSPGEYALEFAASRGGKRNLLPQVTLTFIISPPFYLQKWFFGLLGVSLAAIVFIFFRVRIQSIRNKATYRQHLAETEMAALKAQMNPHFIFNCINCIDSFIQSNDKYHATLYLNRFAKLIRNVLDSSKENTVSFSQDIDTLKLYVELEELRSAHSFKVIWQVDEGLMQDDYLVPPLIVQPFVENAIIHGLRNMETGKGVLQINIQKSDGHIKYEVTDNGIGREASELLTRAHTKSYGVKMTLDRVKLFNNDTKPSVEISDAYPGADNPGTRVILLLKIEEC